MPSSRLSSVPTTYPSFLKHRYEDNPRFHPLNINLSIPAPVPAWASLPTPPMSVTPPPDQLFETSQLAGRRRKREATPPSSSHQPTPPVTSHSNISPLVEQTSQRYGDFSRMGRMADPSMLPSSHLLPWDHTPSFVTGGGQGYALVTSNMPPRPLQVSPRATRKVKAHVASACVNCKRKHLRCDESRPCRRCVQSGKEDTCKDVEHKKRGRPPLKDHGSDNSRTMHSGIVPAPMGLSSSRAGPGPNLVPLLPTPMPSRLPYGPSYAAASVAQSSATAQGQFSNLSSRPFNFNSIRQQVPDYPQYNSHSNVSAFGYPGQEQISPQYRYGGPDQSANMSNMYSHTDYQTPIFSRRSVPSQPLMEPLGAEYGAPLQLPPILPSPMASSLDHNSMQRQRQFQPQPTPYGQQYMSSLGPNQHDLDIEERDPKRPKMDMRNILGPRD